MRGKYLIWTSVIAMLLATLFVGPAKAQLPLIYVEAPITPVDAGTNFDISIKIADMGDPGLFAWEIKLKYDRNLLTFVNVVKGPFLESGGGSATDVFYSIDNFRGILMAAQLLTDATQPVAYGAGTLAVVTFFAMTSGTSALDLFETKLIDNTGMLIDHGVQDGSVQVVAPPIPWHAIFWIAPKHGGKVWPAWPVAYRGRTQRLYARVRNTGDKAAFLFVRWQVYDENGVPKFASPIGIQGGFGPKLYEAIFDPDTGKMIAPSDVDVPSTAFGTGTWKAGWYYVTAWAYASAVGPAGPWTKWVDIEPTYGGVGTSRDIGTASFWLK